MDLYVVKDGKGFDAVILPEAVQRQRLNGRYSETRLYT